MGDDGMSEREKEVQALTRSERQRQLGEHIENIIRGIPKAAKCALLVLLGWLFMVVIRP
jgi:hypothetical protein